MAAPLQTKTWQFSNNNGIFFGASATITHQQVLFQIKLSLVSFGTLPWTVSGSSNSVASGMDAVDRWVSSTNLVWSAGAHSWIVLRQTGIASQCELLIDLGTGSGDHTLQAFISPSVGFGTANGGTNGSTSARPTATDEVQLQLFSDGWISGTSNFAHTVHVQQSTDGQCTRAIVCTNNNPVTLWLFDRVANAFSGWTGTKAVFICAASNGTNNLFLHANFQDVKTRTFFKHSSLIGNFYLCTPGYVSSSITRSTAGTVPNDVTKEWYFGPITLASDSTSLRGLWGTMIDIYYGSIALNAQTSYERSGTPHYWQQFGEMIFPWDSSSVARVG